MFNFKINILLMCLYTFVVDAVITVICGTNGVFYGCALQDNGNTKIDLTEFRAWVGESIGFSENGYRVEFYPKLKFDESYIHITTPGYTRATGGCYKFYTEPTHSGAGATWNYLIATAFWDAKGRDDCAHNAAYICANSDIFKLNNNADCNFVYNKTWEYCKCEVGSG